jgi:hypothetical protein
VNLELETGGGNAGVEVGASDGGRSGDEPDHLHRGGQSESGLVVVETGDPQGVSKERWRAATVMLGLRRR